MKIFFDGDSQFIEFIDSTGSKSGLSVINSHNDDLDSDETFLNFESFLE